MKNACNPHAERKRILPNNIYGVDLDAQAVEVAKLSLSLCVNPREREMIERQIFTLDRPIGTLVYDLYRLTGDEIRLVEQEIWGCPQILVEKIENIHTAADSSPGIPGSVAIPPFTLERF